MAVVVVVVVVGVAVVVVVVVVVVVAAAVAVAVAAAAVVVVTAAAAAAEVVVVFVAVAIIMGSSNNSSRKKLNQPILIMSTTPRDLAPKTQAPGSPAAPKDYGFLPAFPAPECYTKDAWFVRRVGGRISSGRILEFCSLMRLLHRGILNVRDRAIT